MQALYILHPIYTYAKNQLNHGNTIAISTRKDHRDQYDYTYNLDRKNIQEIPEDRTEESAEMLTMQIISAEIKKQKRKIKIQATKK